MTTSIYKGHVLNDPDNETNVATTEVSVLKGIVDSVGAVVSAYGSLSAAITEIGSTYTELIIDKNTAVSTTIVVPENVRLVFKNFAMLTGTGTITISNMDDCIIWQIFGNNLSVNFGDKIKYVRPEWFGSITNADCSAIVNKADAVASASGRVLKFRSFTYNGYGFTPSAKWVGNKTTIKNTYAAPYSGGEKYFFVYCDTDGWEAEGITFDGSVSADPGTWNLTTLDQFTGCIPLFLDGISNFKIKNCSFINALFSGLRIVDCSYGWVENVNINKCRSSFGDGIYIESSNNINVDGGYIYDVTRIGVVTDGVATEEGSYYCTFTNLTIEYAHHGSIIYGGSQYNFGFWFENTASNTIDNCKIYNTVHGGIHSTTGINTNLPEDVSTTLISNCTVRDIESGYGLFIASLSGGTVANTNVVNCSIYNTPIGIAVKSENTNDDSVNIINCHIAYHNDTQNTCGAFFIANIDNPVVNIKNCSIEHLEPGVTRLENTSYSAGDIVGTDDGDANATINIDNVYNVDETKRLYIKSVGTTGYNFNIVNCNTNQIWMSTNAIADLNVSNCKVGLLESFGTRATIKNSNIYGRVVLQHTYKSVLNNSFYLSTGPLGTDVLFLINITASTDGFNTIVDGNYFYRDFDTYSYALRIQNSSSNNAVSLVKNNCFYSTSVLATSLDACIWIPLLVDYTKIIFEDNKCDSRVVYPLLINSTLYNRWPGLDDTVMHAGDSVTNGKYYSGDIRLISTTASTTKDTGALTLEGGIGLEGAIVGPKYRTTIEGGFAVLLTNRTGGASVKGEVVRVSSSYNNAVTKIVVDVPDPIGVFYESGVADGSEAWVVISGIADVYFIGNTTRGYLARGFITGDAGYVTGQALAEAVPSAPFATDKHFYEIGHVLESRTGAGLAKCVLHFN